MNRTLKLISLGIIVLGFTSSTYAIQQKDISIANRSEMTGKYEVGFCGRPSEKGIPTHAFVMLTHTDPSGNITMKSIGHTAADKVNAVLSWFGDPAEGFLEAEKFTHQKQMCLNVGVDLDQYAKVLAHTESALEEFGFDTKNTNIIRSYKLGEKDCLSYVIDIAKDLGIKTPDRGKYQLPYSYIKELVKIN